jgi:hypothetical protein
MPTLTQPKFLNYQNIFYRNVIVSPMVISLGVQAAVASTGNFLTDFVGNAPVTGYPVTWYDFPAFYFRDLEEHFRENFGDTSEENNTVYLSPLQIIDVFGSYDYLKLNHKNILVRLDGHESQVKLVTHMEPLFGSCIAIELRLQGTLRG